MLDIKTVMPAECTQLVQESCEGKIGGLSYKESVFLYDNKKMSVVGVRVNHFADETSVRFLLKSQSGRYFFQDDCIKAVGCGFTETKTSPHVSHAFMERAIYWYLMMEEKRLSFSEAFGFEPELA